MKGYSLIELLICSTIIGILAAISLPSLISFYQRKKEESAACALIHALSYAHREALIKSTPVALCPSKNQKICEGDWKDGYIIFLDLYGDGSIKNAAQLLTVQQDFKLSGIIHYRAYPRYRDYLRFKAEGWMDNDNGTFWYCRTKKASPSFAIFFSKFAKIRLVYPDKEGQIKLLNGKLLKCDA